MPDRIDDRIAGCLLGGAIGDALGHAAEGGLPSEVGDHHLGTVSDDTQLTLATVEAIVASQGRVTPESVAERLLAWFKEGRVHGVGSATLGALRGLAAGGHWALVGRRGEYAAGDGAAMRVAPLGFLLDPKSDRDRRTIRDISWITHHSDEAYAGALAVIAGVRLAWKSPEQWPSLLDHVAKILPDTAVRDRFGWLQAERNATLGSIADRFGQSGHVVESVPFALAAAERVQALGFRPMVRDIIEAGGDTDTNASIAGQCAGTFLGASQLPKQLMRRLDVRDEVNRAAQLLTKYVLP